jgi:hypothetical protein
MAEREYRANAILGPVTVVAIEDWENNQTGAKGRNVRFRLGDGGETMKLPIAAGVNGEAPTEGQVCRLSIEVYPWHVVRTARSGESFVGVDTKLRVVGVAA